MHWIDPDALPETTGTLDTLIFNARGELDGFVLDGDRLVHVSPHLGALLGRRARVGAHVALRAIKPRAANLLAAVAVTLDGRRHVDDGPDTHQPPAPPVTRPANVVGSVRLTLHAPRGEVCGALLQDGTVVRIHPGGNQALGEYFEPGRRIEVWGQGLRKAGALVIDLEHVAYIAESEEQAQSFADGGY